MLADKQTVGNKSSSCVFLYTGRSSLGDLRQTLEAPPSVLFSNINLSIDSIANNLGGGKRDKGVNFEKEIDTL